MITVERFVKNKTVKRWRTTSSPGQEKCMVTIIELFGIEIYRKYDWVDSKLGVLKFQNTGLRSHSTSNSMEESCTGFFT